MRAGDTYEAECRIRRFDGSCRRFLVRAEPVRAEDGTILRWVGTSTHIDERRRQAAALEEFTLRLEEQVRERTADRNALWQRTPDLMPRCSFDGLVTATNPAWPAVLGWEERDLLGGSLLDLAHPDDEARTLEGMRELPGGRGHARFDNRDRQRS